MGSHTLHIWHCAQCHLCFPYYRWAHTHCIFGIVHNAICASPTTDGLTHIAHLALCTMPFVLPLLQMGSHTLHIWHCAQCHLCFPYYRWAHTHCTFGIVHNAICASPTTDGLTHTAHLALCTMPFMPTHIELGSQVIALFALSPLPNVYFRIKV